MFNQFVQCVTSLLYTINAFLKEKAMFNEKRETFITLHYKMLLIFFLNSYGTATFNYKTPFTCNLVIIIYLSSLLKYIDKGTANYSINVLYTKLLLVQT